MSVPRITELLDQWIEDWFSSQGEATQGREATDLILFAVLRELKKIRLILEDAHGMETPDDDVSEDEENR